MVVIHGRLEPEGGAVLMQAIAAAREELYQRCRAVDVPAGTSAVGVVAEPPTMDQQQADALGQSVLEGGTRVSAETSQRLACDASRVVMRHDADGRLMEVGGALASPAAHAVDPRLRVALTLRATRCYNARASRPLERSGGSA